MSGRSKRQPRRLSATKQMNRDLLIFLWAWVSVTRPAAAQIYAVRDEIMSLAESVRLGNVTEKMIADQLAAECDLLTDWNRRDRQR